MMKKYLSAAAIGVYLWAYYSEQTIAAILAAIFLIAMLAGIEWLKNHVPRHWMWIAGGFGVLVAFLPTIDPTFPGDHWTAAGMGLLAFAFYGTLYHLDEIFLGIGRVIRRIAIGK